MDFRRNKTYHDILAEQRPGGDEHLVADDRTRWLAAAGGIAAYLLVLAFFYWASGIGFQKRLGLEMELDTVPAWKHVIGLLLNTSAVGFSAIFLVSAVLWALKAASPKYFMVFGALGLFAGLLVALVL